MFCFFSFEKLWKRHVIIFFIALLGAKCKVQTLMFMDHISDGDVN